METIRRSLVKAVSWRVVATIITMIVSYMITGNIKIAASIGAIDTLIKLLAYFLHERLWIKIPFGKVRAPEYEI